MPRSVSCKTIAVLLMAMGACDAVHCECSIGVEALAAAFGEEPLEDGGLGVLDLPPPPGSGAGAAGQSSSCFGAACDEDGNAVEAVAVS
mmetsp:Transcript_69673/g.151605  ORF Transcript_69673/g.151605 Transcript_69673/m.151605 type:complete len:89 (-) Transcript_69673:700-966(-)